MQVSTIGIKNCSLYLNLLSCYSGKLNLLVKEGQARIRRGKGEIVLNKWAAVLVVEQRNGVLI
jgi:hypothetical protein